MNDDLASLIDKRIQMHDEDIERKKTEKKEREFKENLAAWAAGEQYIESCKSEIYESLKPSKPVLKYPCNHCGHDFPAHTEVDITLSK